MVGFNSRVALQGSVAAFLALCAVYDASAQQYRVTDLGALGFTPVPDSRGSFGINNKGQVAFGRDPQPPFNLDEIQAAIWLPEADYGFPTAGIHMLALPPPPHTLPSILRDANLHGQFVGQVSGLSAGEGEAVVYDLGADPSETRLLGFLPDGGWSRAMAITDASPAMVVGESELEAVKCDPCSNDTAQFGLRSFWVTLVEDPLSLFQLLPLLDCPEQNDASS